MRWRCWRRSTPSGSDSGSSGLITLDEESSGIIDAADIIGRGWFVFDAQAHKASPNPASVELGQLLAMKVKSWRKVYG